MATLKYNAKKLELLIPTAKRHTVAKFRRDNSEIRPSNIDDIVAKVYTDLETIAASIGVTQTFVSLTDSPDNYDNSVNRITGVNGTEDGVEFKNWEIVASNLYPGSAGGTIGKAGNGVGKLYFDSSGNIDYEGDLTILTGGVQKAVFEATTGYLGLGVSDPVEPLDSVGGIKIGNAVQSTGGTIRYTANDFQGYDGTTWKSFFAVATSGSGTTVNGTAVDLGGTLTSAAAINGAGLYGIDLGNDVTGQNLTYLTANAGIGSFNYSDSWPSSGSWGLSELRTKASSEDVMTGAGSSISSRRQNLTRHLYDITDGTSTSQAYLEAGEFYMTSANIAGASGSRVNLNKSTGLWIGTYAAAPTFGGKLEIAGSNVFTDYNAGAEGLQYAADYSATFVARSLVDRAYADSLVSGLTTNATHSGDAIGDTALTLQPVAITGKTAAAALTGTETVLLEQSGGLVKSTAQDIADLGGGDSLYTADGTLTAPRVVTMGANPLSFEGNTVTVKGLGSLTGTTFSARNALNQESLKVLDNGDVTSGILNNNLIQNGYISTFGARVIHLNAAVHTFKAATNSGARGCAVFTSRDGLTTSLSVATDGIGVGKAANGIFRVQMINTSGGGFSFADSLGTTLFRHSNVHQGDRYGLGFATGSGSAATDGILNIKGSETWGASIKLLSGVDPTGTNKSGGSQWYTASKMKFQTGTDTIQLYAQDNTVSASALVGGGGTAITDTDTFGGFTLQQLAQLLLNNGLAK
tara:strand:+ start:366 stop:2612 length:2247 start_codon:yes stop_codon:yes gene_type:complete